MKSPQLTLKQWFEVCKALEMFDLLGPILDTSPEHMELRRAYIKIQYYVDWASNTLFSNEKS